MTLPCGAWVIVPSSSRNEWVWRSHADPIDATREVKLDMVDAVLDLLADSFHPAIGSINLQRMARSQEMSDRGGEEITAGEQPGADMLPESKARFHATSMK